MSTARPSLQEQAQALQDGASAARRSAVPLDPPRVGARELLVWIVVFLAIGAARVASTGGPQFFNDSYQYLSIADNLRSRHAVSTSIVHFDTERARGQVPAPETTLPPGYSLLVWASSATGIPSEWAGLLVSLLAAAAVLPLLRSAGSALRLPADAMRACLAAWTFSAQASLYAITLYSEAAFTAASLAAVVLLLTREAGAPSWRVPAAMLLAGAAFWIRYAGLFFAAALHAYALLQAVRWRRQPGLWLASLALCDVPVALLMARNAAIAGTWMGGNDRPVEHGAGFVLHRLASASYELLIGSIQRNPPTVLLLLALLLAAGAIATSVAAVRALARTRRVALAATPAQAVLLLVCVASYLAGYSYASATTHVSAGARMLLPVLPAAELLLSVLFTSIPRPPAPAGRPRVSRSAALAAAAYVAANCVSALQEPRVAEHRAVAEALALPTSDGRSLAQWIGVSVPGDAVLLAVEGQATGYLLRRSTISTVGRAFTELGWSEEESRLIMARFGARYLVVYPEVVASGGSDGLESEFLERLAARRPPGWLELAAENPRALVFRARGEAGRGGGIDPVR